MEGESTSALLSGFVFGALAFQHLNAGSDTEGFLLGDVKGEAKNSITDSQMDDVEVVYTIDIQKHIPCYQLFSFYSSAGDLNEAALKKILSGCEKNVIGWYKFRRNTDQTMTFRERILHRNLQSKLSNQGLVFLLLTSSVTTESCSTYRLEHALHRPQEGLFQKVPLVVTNLGMAEQQGYRTVAGSCISAGFGRAVRKHRSDFFYEDGSLKEVQKINEMYATLQEELKKTCTKVEVSERTVEKLLAEVGQLKQEIKRKKEQIQTSGENKSGSNEPPENIFLCQALQTFFPYSGLQTCIVSLQGRPILEHCCNTDHNINITNKLTLMLEDSDFPEAGTKQLTKRKARGTTAGPKSLKKSRPLKLHQKLLQGDQEDSDQERKITLSGTETDEEALEKLKDTDEYPHSPTF
ncbi:BRCA1-A complex subunit Abraxas 1 isoform X2 [Alligator mississippiensis]|uniref:BRCA1-A complex subunit Abraxas 1 n=1 Tax=Alligator mississippiensis TaxID=8496 RepID=A0A151P0T6_ALLMI|nr:BRCA1-A complex subunit Abraxas 1 isoform X2 [Alligator mississippiensis]KYO42732.1 BRCA1-A complex subunit Abraxas [Alligator mississippiensis]